MGIELKYLAPYLPYQLKAYQRFEGIDLVKEIDNMNIMNHVFGDTNSKPILRPMSDVLREIEHKGERFIPSKTIERQNKPLMKGFGRFDFDTWDWDLLIKNFPYHILPNWIVEELIMWHFDVFGLIEKGLAVDKNNLEKVK